MANNPIRRNISLEYLEPKPKSLLDQMVESHPSIEIAESLNKEQSKECKIPEDFLSVEDKKKLLSRKRKEDLREHIQGTFNRTTTKNPWITKTPYQPENIIQYMNQNRDMMGNTPQLMEHIRCCVDQGMRPEDIPVPSQDRFQQAPKFNIFTGEAAPDLGRIVRKTICICQDPTCRIGPYIRTSDFALD